MDSATTPFDTPTLDTAHGVLAAVRADRLLADDAERHILIGAVAWADLHPAGPEDLPAWAGPEDTGEPGYDVPPIREYALAEFAAALGLSTEAGRMLILEALWLRLRLPLVWAELLAGRLQAWRARRIAKATLTQPADMLAFLDARIAPIAAKVGPITLDKLIDEAMMLFHPAERLAAQQAALDARYVRLFDHITHNGVAELRIRADLADALGFHDAIKTIAVRLGELGDTDTYDIRCSKAVGILASPTAAAFYLAPSTTPETSGNDGQAAGGSPAAAAASAASETKAAGTGLAIPAHRQLTLHVHLSDAALTGTALTGTALTGHGSGTPATVARLENGARPVLAELIRDWCGNPATQVTVLPVRDLADHHHVAAYETPDRLKHQSETINHTCVFPWCTRPARKCDKDHNVPYDDGGATCSCNIAPLCRRHHRLKTHNSGWTYQRLDDGIYLWTSPHHLTWLRDLTGTSPIDTDGVIGRAQPPPGNGCQHEPAA